MAATLIFFSQEDYGLLISSPHLPDFTVLEFETALMAEKPAST